MKKAATLLALVGVGVLMLAAFPNFSLARLTGTNPTGASADAVCAGKKGNEACVDSSGNIIPTTNNSEQLGTSSLQWSDVEAVKLNNGGGNLAIGGNLAPAMPASQSLVANSTISVAGACGGTVQIQTTGPITLSNVTPIGIAPVAPCTVVLANVGATGAVTIPNAAGTDNWIGATGIILQPSRAVQVTSTSTLSSIWMNLGATPQN